MSNQVQYGVCLKCQKRCFIQPWMTEWFAVGYGGSNRRKCGDSKHEVIK